MDLREFNARDVVGPMKMVTRARDLKVAQVTGSLELSTDRGDIELVPGKTPLPSIDARSGSGTVELVLPDKAAFQLEATVHRGDATNDYGSSITHETEGRSATLKKSGDGPMIKIDARQGSITVRKEGSLPSEGPKKVNPKDLKDSEVKM